MKNRAAFAMPNLLAYGFAKAISLFYSLRLNHHLTCRDGKPAKGAAVVLGNHTSSYDQFISGASIPRRMHYLLSDAMYYTLPCPFFFSALRILHKQQSFTTVQSIRQMKNVTDHGGILMLYPAGVCSLCGDNTTLPPATGKFLKMLGADVYILLEHGMYLSNPKWQKGIRRGRVESELYCLLRAEELKKLSGEEIYRKTAQALEFNDYLWQEDHRICYHHADQVAGLENVLYDCPRCGAHFSIENRENRLVCSACGFEEYADAYGFLHSPDPQAEIRYPFVWHDKQKAALKQQLLDNSTFSHEARARIMQLNTEQRKFVPRGEGLVRMDAENLRILLDSGERVYSEKTSRFQMLPMIPGEYFDLQNGDTIYRCFPEEKKEVAYITDFVNSIYELSSVSE